MEEKYTKVFTESTLLVNRLKDLLAEEKIHSRVKSDKIPAYEITNFIDELYVLKSDLEKVRPILTSFKNKIKE